MDNIIKQRFDEEIEKFRSTCKNEEEVNAFKEGLYEALKNWLEKNA